ncbi:MAG: MFS transporter [Caulobacteraceae bacterium]|nr:MFS transporter [Caulobacter sp.]
MRGFGRPADDPASFFGSLGQRWGLLLYVVVLMTAFNLFSHGTQDLYPTFLKVQHGFPPAVVTALTVALNLGAIAGGLLFGALSERIGRRRAIALAAVLALPVIPLWAGASTPLMLGAGAFLIQVAVQGAWGVVPVHLNELSPEAARGTFPGFAYQLGNLIASGNAVLQAGVAEAHGNDYGFALGVTAAAVALLIAALALFGPERKGAQFGVAAAAAPPGD